MGFDQKASSFGRHNNFAVIWLTVDSLTRLFLYCQLAKFLLSKPLGPKAQFAQLLIGRQDSFFIVSWSNGF
jgi:hypothetical protein